MGEIKCEFEKVKNNNLFGQNRYMYFDLHQIV